MKKIIFDLKLITIAFLSLATLTIVPIYSILGTRNSALWISHTHQIKKEINGISESYRRVLFYHRNYVLTGSIESLEKRQIAFVKFYSRVERVKDLLKESPNQISRLEKLKKFAEQTFEEMLQENVEPFFPMNAWMGYAMVGYREKQSEVFLDSLDQLSNEEDLPLEARTQTLQRSILYYSIAAFTVGALATASLIYFANLARIEAEDRKDMMVKLEIALEKANAATKSKSMFLANMSHEIRTPLGAMIGFIDLLGDPNLSTAERKNFADVARRNGDLLQQVVDDILDFSKSESGQIKAELVPTDLPNILDNIFSLVEPKAKANSNRLKFAKMNELPKFILIDPMRLQQILLNLLGNANKFTKSGAIVVEVHWRKLDDSHTGRLSFRITDTGCGIAKEHQKSLFQPFSQADSSTTRLFGGTGLGLTLSRNLARLMSGDVVLENSAPNVGTTFLVWFDVQDLPTYESSSGQAQDTINDSPLRQNLAGMRVLVVDDAPDNRALITRYLEMEGADVEEANDGIDAVQKATSSAFDAILMDIQMPRMDGYDATRAIRALNYSGTIVALTAHVLSAERDKMVEAGCNGVLKKPVNKTLLISALLEARKGSIQISPTLANMESGNQQT